MSDAVADLLFETRGPGVLDIPDDAVADMTEGLRLQLAVLDRWRRAGERVGGWKIGFSAGPGRAAVQEGFRPFGYILASRIFGSGVRLPGGDIGRAVLEPEICLTMGSALSGTDVTAEEARAAVTAVAPAFEINALRLPGSPLPLIVADDLAQWGIVVGDEVPAAGVDLMATAVEVFHDGAKLAEQSASDHLDDPYLSLALVCRTLADFGLGLESGQRVITGAFSVHDNAGAGVWRAVFSGLGEVELGLVELGLT